MPTTGAGTLPWRRDTGEPTPIGPVWPPHAMARFDRGRPIKRWCYAGLYGGDLMLCAGSVRVGGIPQSFWAVWDRRTGIQAGRTLLTRTGRAEATATAVRVDDAGTQLALQLHPAGEPVEVLSPHGSSYIWTRKTPIRAIGELRSPAGAPTGIDALGILDESAGYHARRTDWQWSAGVGHDTAGRRITWNLVTGVHDAVRCSERTVWIDGAPAEVGPVRFSRQLDRVDGDDGTALQFSAEATRQRRDNLLLVRSDYVQPFGTFTGRLAAGIELGPDAFGVMERHHAVW